MRRFTRCPDGFEEEEDDMEEAEQAVEGKTTKVEGTAGMAGEEEVGGAAGEGEGRDGGAGGGEGRDGYNIVVMTETADVGNEEACVVRLMAVVY